MVLTPATFLMMSLTNRMIKEGVCKCNVTLSLDREDRG